ncbi:hypothetical protein [Marinobacterium sedimentorum]|uniref:hypothetical protein n=1 Tax=Marinobacterium sedimentorum TaxID=2927804 RepID=UPI0020C6B68E|nr:hypothetical protein [Marinobacterium sedimentorum]MCP8689311.1 hypothetical protein [Marinobacterium sedimentorum]
MRQMESSSELLLETSFIWHEISVGDLIRLEADLDDCGEQQLRTASQYEVLAKLELAPGHQVFVVQSDISGELVQVHPFLVSSYDNRPAPTCM